METSLKKCGLIGALVWIICMALVVTQGLRQRERAIKHSPDRPIPQQPVSADPPYDELRSRL